MYKMNLKEKFSNHSEISIKRYLLSISDLEDEITIGDIRKFLTKNLEIIEEEKLKVNKNFYLNLENKIYKIKNENYINVIKIEKIVDVRKNYNGDLDAIINGKSFFIDESNIEYEYFESQWYNHIFSNGEKEEISLEDFEDIFKKYKEIIKYYGK